MNNYDAHLEDLSKSKNRCCTWWRYSDKTEPNQHIGNEGPSLEEGSELFMHHSSRDIELNPVGSGD